MSRPWPGLDAPHRSGQATVGRETPEGLTFLRLHCFTCHFPLSDLHHLRRIRRLCREASRKVCHRPDDDTDHHRVDHGVSVKVPGDDGGEGGDKPRDKARRGPPVPVEPEYQGDEDAAGDDAHAEGDDRHDKLRNVSGHQSGDDDDQDPHHPRQEEDPVVGDLRPEELEGVGGEGRRRHEDDGADRRHGRRYRRKKDDGVKARREERRGDEGYEAVGVFDEGGQLLGGEDAVGENPYREDAEGVYGDRNGAVDSGEPDHPAVLCREDHDE